MNIQSDAHCRYQYYLQLKADVIDGKLSCTAPQAVLLASYSVQGKRPGSSSYVTTYRVDDWLVKGVRHLLKLWSEIGCEFKSRLADWPTGPL